MLARVQREVMMADRYTAAFGRVVLLRRVGVQAVALSLGPNRPRYSSPRYLLLRLGLMGCILLWFWRVVPVVLCVAG